MSASLSIVLPLGPSYARSAARHVGVVCHHHRLEEGSSRTERRGLCDESHTSTNTIVVLHGYHTRHLFRLAVVSTKRTVDSRTRRPSSSSLWLLSLAKYHTISSFGNMWQKVQRCAIVKARAPCTLLLRLTPVLVQLLHWSFRERLGEVVPGFLIDKVDLFQAYVPPLARVFLQLQEANRCWVVLLSRSTKDNYEAPCTSKVNPWPA